MRLLHALLAEKAVCKRVDRLDQWLHFHRFEKRPVCDLHDWLHGVKGHELIESRRDGTPAHQRLRSRERHPSARVAA